jgi:predicted phosphohydrolase
MGAEARPGGNPGSEPGAWYLPLGSGPSPVYQFPMRLAVTADLHWGHSAAGDAATQALARQVRELAPDCFAIAGDVGTGIHWEACLEQFGGLQCPRLVTPGNHDLWTEAPTPASMHLWERELAERAEQVGFHYLDRRPFTLAGSSEAVVGSINWYDYSLVDGDLEREHPGAREMFTLKRFPRGRHNDGVYVRLGTSDADFTTMVVARFEEQLATLPEAVDRVIVVQHHPPLRALASARPPTTLAGRWWMAFAGNARMERAVLADPRTRIVLCGHTHCGVAAEVKGRLCRNLGGDYHWKRLLLLDSVSGQEQWWEFVPE